MKKKIFEHVWTKKHVGQVRAKRRVVLDFVSVVVWSCGRVVVFLFFFVFFTHVDGFLFFYFWITLLFVVAGWKKPERLLGGQSLYGRASKPKSDASSPGSSPRKAWFVEPALGDKSRGLSDWWLNYALGALAESSEAERAIEEAEQSGMMSGKSFMEVLERQTLKIVDHYKTQMSREQEEVSWVEKKRTRQRTRKKKEKLCWFCLLFGDCG